jgi:hypothetical protein
VRSQLFGRKSRRSSTPPFRYSWIGVRGSAYEQAIGVGLLVTDGRTTVLTRGKTNTPKFFTGKKLLCRFWLPISRLVAGTDENLEN